ncbi:hypothetical protein J3E69DRAFT_331632 [Trichoderma sp. SZMC 28015]
MSFVARVPSYPPAFFMQSSCLFFFLASIFLPPGMGCYNSGGQQEATADMHRIAGRGRTLESQGPRPPSPAENWGDFPLERAPDHFFCWPCV